MKLRSLVDRLLPLGTRRRYFCDLVYTDIHVVRHEGWRTFFRRVRIWFRPRWMAGGKLTPNIVDLRQCGICGGLFRLPNPHIVDNLRETPLCHNCRATKRQQDVAKILLNVVSPHGSSLVGALEDFRMLKVYLLESYGPIHSVLSKSGNFVCSEFWDNVPPRKVIKDVRCEDVQDLTFGDESFDLVITQDVFEHVPDPERGFKEIYRVLKPGGYHIFTVPFNKSLDKSIRRAMIRENSISYILPPVYHGDKLRRQGALVFTDFGLDLLEMLAAVGFGVETHEESDSQYKGGYIIVFICRK